ALQRQDRNAIVELPYPQVLALKERHDGNIRLDRPHSYNDGIPRRDSMTMPLLQSEVPGYPCRHGKVRDVYDLGDKLVIVATDRISAFDFVLPSGIPDKGRILSQLTLFWLDYLKVPNHLISTDVTAMPPVFASQASVLQG